MNLAPGQYEALFDFDAFCFGKNSNQSNCRVSFFKPAKLETYIVHISAALAREVTARVIFRCAMKRTLFGFEISHF